MGILAVTWDVTWEAYEADSGMVRTDWHTLWSPGGEYWGQPSRTQCSCKAGDLALGTDCDSVPESLIVTAFNSWRSWVIQRDFPSFFKMQNHFD